MTILSSIIFFAGLFFGVPEAGYLRHRVSRPRHHDVVEFNRLVAGELAWQTRALTAELASRLRELWPDGLLPKAGYTSEVCPRLAPWIATRQPWSESCFSSGRKSRASEFSVDW